MASIENKSRTQVSVKKHDDLTKFFPHHKAGAAAAAAYMAELEAEGLKPSATVLDEAYLVRFSTDEGRRSHTARSAAEAEAIKKKVEADQYHGLYVDYTKAHKIKLSDLLIRYLWEEAPRLKGFLITAYQINSWLVDAGLPRQDIAAVHAAHPNPQDPDLHIPTPNGQRMSEPNEAAKFILKPFSKLEPSDFTRYVDERVEDVDTATADRELDIIRRVCSLAVNTWRIHVRLRIHDLRHEAISRVAEAGSQVPGGISLIDLQAFSGHRDTRMLLRYTHLPPGGLAKRLDLAFKDKKQVTFHRGRRRLAKNASLAGSPLSPEAALSDLRRIQRHSVSIDDAAPVQGLSTITPGQAAVLAALNIKKPTHDAQMSLL